MFKWILLWLLLGVLGLLILFIDDMRGQKYNPDYFKFYDGFDYFSFLIVTIMGPITLIIVFVLIIYKKYQNYITDNPEKSFTRLLYNLANLGLKDKEQTDETDI